MLRMQAIVKLNIYSINRQNKVLSQHKLIWITINETN